MALLAVAPRLPRAQVHTVLCRGRAGGSVVAVVDGRAVAAIAGAVTGVARAAAARANKRPPEVVQRAVICQLPTWMRLKMTSQYRIEACRHANRRPASEWLSVDNHDGAPRSSVRDKLAQAVATASAIARGAIVDFGAQRTGRQCAGVSAGVICRATGQGGNGSGYAGSPTGRDGNGG